MSDILQKVEDVAKDLGLADSTIRKYSKLFELQGYKFNRSAQGALMYNGKEIQMFQELLELKKDMPLNEAVLQVLYDVMDISEIAVTSDMSAIAMANMLDVENMVTAISDMQAQMKAILEQNTEVINQNKALMNKVELLEDSEKKQIADRDKLLLQSLEESRKVRQEQQELKQLILESTNKKWYQFWK